MGVRLIKSRNWDTPSRTSLNWNCLDMKWRKKSRSGEAQRTRRAQATRMTSLGQRRNRGNMTPYLAALPFFQNSVVSPPLVSLHCTFTSVVFRVTEYTVVSPPPPSPASGPKPWFPESQLSVASPHHSFVSPVQSASFYLSSEEKKKTL